MTYLFHVCGQKQKSTWFYLILFYLRSKYGNMVTYLKIKIFTASHELEKYYHRFFSFHLYLWIFRFTACFPYSFWLTVYENIVRLKYLNQHNSDFLTIYLLQYSTVFTVLQYLFWYPKKYFSPIHLNAANVQRVLNLFMPIFSCQCHSVYRVARSVGKVDRENVLVLRRDHISWSFGSLKRIRKKRQR